MNSMSSFILIRIQYNLCSIDRKDSATHLLRTAGHPKSIHTLKMHFSKLFNSMRFITKKHRGQNLQMTHFLTSYVWFIHS